MKLVFDFPTHLVDSLEAGITNLKGAKIEKQNEIIRLKRELNIPGGESSDDE